MRGFCALAVVIDHALGMVALPKYSGRTIWWGGLSAGAVGVDRFFVVSGSIITVVALRGEAFAPAVSRVTFGW